ncbi:MAG: hypothetical protein IJ184_03165 [Alphaproteobacteria bacterium]|nr:hypothetical protein [Alphaproteobacteria bacterium]
MTNLLQIYNKLISIDDTIHNLCYNVDNYEFRAEKMLLAGEKVSFSDIKKHIKHCLDCQKWDHNKGFPNFDKLTKREQIYYSAVDCLRGLAVKEDFNV